MIKYTLTCDQDHQFESWFQNADAFDKLHGLGRVACMTCGSSEVKKSLMAPAVGKTDAVTPVNAPHPMEKLRAEVEANSDYVGMSFAQEARDMHDGLVPERPIFGEAKLPEAKKLIEDGVPVMPLPFIPSKKAH